MRPKRTKGAAPAAVAAAGFLYLPLLASCMDVDAREPLLGSSPCTVVSYMGPQYSVLELRVRENADHVWRNIKAAPAEESMIRLGEGAYMPKNREILGIGSYP